ncbi:MAG: Hsp70 family protein [Phycisphaerae bacterium]|nr:Hsp70 family protein [Phycisphaerae bacterium]
MAIESDQVVGIDLGTTFSAIAYVDSGGRVRTIPNREGELTTPSAVLIEPDRTVHVGRKALRARVKQPNRVAVAFKRDMGEKFYRETIGGREFSPEALSALVLKKLVGDATAVIPSIGGAVVTVPAYFGDARRKATQDAGRIASIEVLDIINEPTAAALANAFRQYLHRGGDTTRFELAAIATTAPSTTLVFDLGGGTFDVTIIRIEGERLDVLATGGEVRLGGIDFDVRLVTHFCDEFVRRHGIDLRDSPESLAQIQAFCEMAKITLSSRTQTVIVGERYGKQLHLPISRRQLEELTADLLARTQISVENLLEDALLTWDRIDDILLVGGASRMPVVADMLNRISGKKPNMDQAPDEIVAHGAAIHAAILHMRTSSAVSVAVDGSRTITTPEVGVEPASDTVAVPDLFDQKVVDATRKVRMTDVNSHGLGVVVRDSRENTVVNSVIIPKNTPLPTERVKVFGTEAANQRIVRLRILEGDTRDPRGCTQIGECVIRHLPKGLPKGSPVEVSFRYDTSGRIHVRAVELKHSTTAEVELVRNTGFDQVDLTRLTNAVSEIDIE